MAVTGYGSAYVGSGIYLKTICKLSTDKKNILLTFDDGPDEKVTPLILDVLKKHHAKAIFFCIGKQVVKHPDLIKRITAEGHTIGNHTWSHAPLIDFYPASRMEEELNETAKAIENAGGIHTNLFRPPYGVTNPPIAKAVNKLNYKTIGWSIRSLDTSIKYPEKLYRRVVSKLKGDDIILFHDTQMQTVEVLDRLLDYLPTHGYTLTNSL
jgi:peptidoglycan/xylan/chitin deacetylase (PgdA/CDA1 family)